MAISLQRTTIFPHWFSLLLLLLLTLLYCVNGREILDSFKVGVFEHTVIVGRKDLDTREMAIQAMKKNLDVFNETVIKARAKGVKMIVFPEYGMYDASMTRERMSLFAETIPDYKDGHPNPCNGPEFQNQSAAVQRMLSCMAKDNEMFLVVNMAARETCIGEPGCPRDGQYLYNSNVVFSPRGEVVARYYKTHLFWEEAWFNSSRKYEIAVFDTPIGKFGSFMCFDHAAIELIEQHNVRNIAYPAAWVNLPPIFQSVQTHSAFARMAKANLLVASVHRLQTNSFGSGIYTPDGAEVSEFRPDIAQSRLLVATIHRIDIVAPKTSDYKKIPSFNPEGESVENLFIRGDFTFLKYQQFKNNSGTVKVCYKNLCCHASYAVKDRFQEVYALGAYEGYLVAGQNKLYFQICTILQCPSGKCGTKITSVKTVFERFQLHGVGFTDRFVFPSFAVMKKNHLELAPRSWTYSKEKVIKTNPNTTIPLHSANLIARVYGKDYTVNVKKPNPATDSMVKMAVKYVFYMIVAYVYAAF